MLTLFPLFDCPTAFEGYSTSNYSDDEHIDTEPIALNVAINPNQPSHPVDIGVSHFQGVALKSDSTSNTASLSAGTFLHAYIAAYSKANFTQTFFLFSTAIQH